MIAMDQRRCHQYNDGEIHPTQGIFASFGPWILFAGGDQTGGTVARYGDFDPLRQGSDRRGR